MRTHSKFGSWLDNIIINIIFHNSRDMSVIKAVFIMVTLTGFAEEIASVKSYEGFRVMRISPSDARNRRYISELLADSKLFSSSNALFSMFVIVTVCVYEREREWFTRLDKTKQEKVMFWNLMPREISSIASFQSLFRLCFHGRGAQITTSNRINTSYMC